MEPSRRKLGIGKVVEGEILKGASDDEVLAVVKKHFPTAKTNIRCIQWYRCKLGASGYEVSRSAEARHKPTLRLVA